MGPCFRRDDVLVATRILAHSRALITPTSCLRRQRVDVCRLRPSSRRGELDARDRQTKAARIRFRLEGTTDPSELAGPGWRQIDSDFEIINAGRNVVVRNTPAIDEEPCIHFGQIPNRQAFDVDGLAARIGSQAKRHPVSPQPKLPPPAFPKRYKSRCTKPCGL